MSAGAGAAGILASVVRITLLETPASSPAKPYFSACIVWCANSAHITRHTEKLIAWYSVYLRSSAVRQMLTFPSSSSFCSIKKVPLAQVMHQPPSRQPAPANPQTRRDTIQCMDATHDVVDQVTYGTSKMRAKTGSGETAARSPAEEVFPGQSRSLPAISHGCTSASSTVHSSAS